MREKIIKRPVLLLLTLILLLALTASWSYQKSSAPKPVKKVTVEHPKVEILMKDGKIMIFELYPEYAPETVKNFIKLSKEGFYNGLKFHRIIKGFMAQGGDPKGDGTGGSNKDITGEFAANGFTKNTLKHTRGVISMARGEDFNTASSQFFIMDAPNTGLDGNYAAFGKMIQGDKTLDSIMNTPVKVNPYMGEVSVPKKDVIIKKIIVLSDGNK